MKRILCVFLLSTLINFLDQSFAALPFVTDDALIQKPGQLAIETFAEKWDEPAKIEANKSRTSLYSYFLSSSIGLTKHAELSIAANAGYDTKAHAASFMNPIVQLKTKFLDSKDSGVPGVAIDWGYVNKNGKGEYFDPATNYYAIAAFTSRFFNDKFMVHLNIGKKASYDIPHSHLFRTHLGIGVDAALTDKFRLVVEGYNGAPNSPRDSPDFFHSYQVGVKWMKSDKFYPYIIYGSQVTYAGSNDDGKMLYRRTSWIQVGARVVFDSFL